MAVYVDDVKHYNYGKYPGWWCHMMTDGDLEELHEMAELIGLKRKWFQNDNPRYPHYDLSVTRRGLAIRHGAIPLTSKEFVEKFRKY